VGAKVESTGFVVINNGNYLYRRDLYFFWSFGKVDGPSLMAGEFIHG
jgi:hypothetical protein